MSNFDPSDPFPQDRPRSSPIPGASAPITIGSPPPGAAHQPPGWGAAAPPGWGTAPAPGGVPWTTVRRGRGAKWAILLAVILPILLTVGITAYVFTAVDSAVDDVRDQIAGSTATPAEGLGLDVDAESLFEPVATAAVVDALDAGIGGSATQYSMIAVYPEYAIAVAEDPAIPGNIDQYVWRAGSVASPTPQSSVDDLDSMLFPSSAVDWNAIGVAAQQAVGLVGVTDGEVTHVIAQRFGGTDVQVSIYVSSVRDSGYLELSADGEVLAVH